MGKYCTFCGSPLNDGKPCTCEASLNAKRTAWDRISEKLNPHRLLPKLMVQMGISDESIKTLNFYERNQNITPDNIAPHDNEVPIKQYNIAILRSRIRGQRAEGRLQITNKRVIFRAAGASLNGRNTIQNEFQVNEIAGIEIRKTNRVSILSILASIILTVLIMGVVVYPFTNFYYKATVLANILAVLMATGAGAVFFFVKKKFWLKLAVNAVALGAISAMIGVDLLSILFEQKIFTFYNTVFFCLALIWLFNMILVSLVPNLVIDIKTKGAGDAMQIRRKQWGMFFSDKKDYTGFSEVLPWVETDIATKEVGAIINDIQTLGDLAIDNWKK